MKGADHREGAEYIDLRLVPEVCLGIAGEHRAPAYDPCIADQHVDVAASVGSGQHVVRLHDVQPDRDDQIVERFDQGRFARSRVNARRYAAVEPSERFNWFSSTGWMMWNTQVGGLLGGTTICIYDGSPAGPKDAPDWGILWRFAARHRVTFFGAGAPFFTSCLKNGLDFAALGDLSRLATLGSTAAPLPAAVQTGISDALAAVDCRAWWFNSSGGTDICGAFCTANLELPPAPGQLQCRQLGAAVESWHERGESLIGDVGELVCVRALPSMPLFLWGDTDGSRYHASYFDVFPGVWRHGDWLKIEPDGRCEIFGRSDATINRGGHRMGTSEIYDAVESLDDIADSLAIDVRTQEGESELILFIVPTVASPPTELATLVSDAIRTSLSPRFVPNSVVIVAEIPRTLTGKKQELPVKRMFEGADMEHVVDLSAMMNPDAMPLFETLAQGFRQRRSI